MANSTIMNTKPTIIMIIETIAGIIEAKPVAQKNTVMMVARNPPIIIPRLGPKPIIQPPMIKTIRKNAKTS